LFNEFLTLNLSTQINAVNWALFCKSLLPPPRGFFSLSPSGLRDLNPSNLGQSLKNSTSWTRTESDRDCPVIIYERSSLVKQYFLLNIKEAIFFK
jgi:hypothetical protein